MGKSYISSKVFKKTFLLYWIILLVPITAFSFGFYRTLKDENNHQMSAVYEIETQKTASLIDYQFVEIIDRLNELQNLSWIYKYLADKEIFADEFTLIDKVKYCADLRRYTGFTGTGSNIAIVYPYKNTVVNGNNWYSMEDFLSWCKLNNRRNLSDIVLKMQQTNEGEYRSGLDYSYVEERFFVFVKSLEIAQEPRLYALFYMDGSLVERSLEKLLSGNLIGMSLKNDSEVLLETSLSPQKSGSVYTEVRKSILQDWSYVFQFQYDYTDAYIKGLYTLVLVIALSFTVGTIAVYWFSLLSYKPLYNLINKLSGFSRESLEAQGTPPERFKDYQFIEMSFDSIQAENARFKRNEDKHRQAMKNNLLTQLLKGYFEGQSAWAGFYESLAACGLVFGEDDWFCVGVLYDIYGDNPSPPERSRWVIRLLGDIEQYMSIRSQACHIYEAVGGELIVILPFKEGNPGREAAELIFSDLAEYTSEKSGVEYALSSGEAYRGLIGISKSYCSAKEFMDNDLPTGRYNSVHEEQRKPIYYYPTDWEIQLITNLKLGNEEVAVKILSEIFSENEKKKLPPKGAYKLSSLLVETMLRVMSEAGIDREQLPMKPEEILSLSDIRLQWQSVLEMGGEVCRKKARLNLSGMESVKHDMIVYVNGHFHHSELSLKDLSQRYGMSVSAVSRAFKEYTGIKFMDYITRRRMEKAKILLEAGCYDMKTIASMVGYDSEYSFRRAFLRSEEIKPGDYAGHVLEKHSKKSLIMKL